MSMKSKMNQKSTKTKYLFEEVIDQTIVDKNRKEPRRKYLGASMLGDKCARKIQYIYTGCEPDEEKVFRLR